MISKEEVLRIAHRDASKIYRDLSVYEVIATSEGGDWHVSYVLADPKRVGGGPEYVISGETGEIISLRYGQ
jgi:hypothetical protein